GGDGVFGGELERSIVTRFALVLYGGDLFDEPEQRRLGYGDLFHGFKCCQIAFEDIAVLTTLDFVPRQVVVPGVDVEEDPALPVTLSAWGWLVGTARCVVHPTSLYLVSCNPSSLRIKKS